MLSERYKKKFTTIFVYCVLWWHKYLSRNSVTKLVTEWMLAQVFLRNLLRWAPFIRYSCVSVCIMSEWTMAVTDPAPQCWTVTVLRSFMQVAYLWRIERLNIMKFLTSNWLKMNHSYSLEVSLKELTNNVLL